VVSAAGDEFTAANGSLSWTLGGTVIETFTAGDYVLTQGFQQGNLTVTSITDPMQTGFNVNVYPNPVQNRLTIEADVHGSEYCIDNMQGKVIKTGKITETALQIDFSDLSNGTYLLKVNGQNTHKIIKQ
jgi:hypothetical protein